MKRKIIYNLPVAEKPLVLDAGISPELLGHDKNEAGRANDEKKLLESKLQESYQKGMHDALEKIKKETKKDIELTCQSLHKAICDLEQERNSIWTQCEKEIVRLALAIAKKAVFHEISKKDSKIIEKVVEEALNKVKGKKILKLHINPADIESLKQREITLLLNNKNYEIVSDSDISPGGCKVVTDFGSVDARLETRWEEIENAFEEHTVEPDLENVGSELENNERENESTPEISSET